MAMNMPVARQQYFDGNGAPLVGGKVAFCQPGTGGATYLPVWADMAETTPLSNPVPLDAAGITMSGGSQVSVWGSGMYEQFVYDADGNLIYSAKVDASVQAGNSFTGTVTIAGNLSVTGSITDTQSLTTPLINGQTANFSGNVQSGTVGTGGVTATSLTVNGNSTINGNETISGSSTVSGTVNAVTLSVGSGGANFSGSNITDVGALSVSSLTVAGAALPITQGGLTTTASGGIATITFSPAFASVQAVVANIAIGPLQGIDWAITNLTNSGCQIQVTSDGAAGAAGINLYWIAVGT